MSAHPSDVPAHAVVQRWRRFGHDRAYVHLGAVDLGYRDLITGEVRATAPQHTDAVARATADLWERLEAERHASYHPRHSAEQPADALDRASSPTRRAPRRGHLTPDRDLTGNRPGQSARRHADDLRAAAPVRTLFERVVGARTDERNWRIGADGEEEVARRLQRLGDEWHVLHAIPVGDRGSDIDHVVVGPAGVFTINVKNHPQSEVTVRGDSVRINGFGVPYVRNSRHEAARAARLLSAAALFDVAVTGLVVVVGARRGFTVTEQPADGRVRVITRKELVSHLQSLPNELGAPSITRIHEVARHLSTWRPNAVERGDV